MDQGGASGASCDVRVDLPKGDGGGFGRWGWGGWGFGIGWPYWGGFWGPYWAIGWDPWWYIPYSWYGPGPAYYPDYSYDWSDDPPPYRPPDSNNTPGNHVSAPNSNLSPNYGIDVSSNSSWNNDDSRFDFNRKADTRDNLVENGESQSGTAPAAEE